MASLRNAEKSFQRLHRERHQPEKRKHLGLLEKKVDYKKRADDFNRKQSQIKKLRQLALDKNPDEFYFHMINSKVVDGVHYEKRKETDTITPEQFKLMHTQDIKYVNYMRNIELKKIEKLKSSLHLIDVEDVPKNTHVYFVDTKADAKNLSKSKETDLNSNVSVQNLSTLTNEKLIDKRVIDDLPKIYHEKRKAYKELARRIEREKHLKVILDKMSVKINLMKPSSASNATLIQEGTETSAPVYKFKNRRQK